MGALFVEGQGEKCAQVCQLTWLHDQPSSAGQVGTQSTNWIKLSWAWPKLDVFVWLGPKWFGLDQMHLLSSYPKLNHLVWFSLA